MLLIIVELVELMVGIAIIIVEYHKLLYSAGEDPSSFISESAARVLTSILVVITLIAWVAIRRLLGDKKHPNIPRWMYGLFLITTISIAMFVWGDALLRRVMENKVDACAVAIISPERGQTLKEGKFDTAGTIVGDAKLAFSSCTPSGTVVFTLFEVGQGGRDSRVGAVEHKIGSSGLNKVGSQYFETYLDVPLGAQPGKGYRLDIKVTKENFQYFGDTINYRISDVFQSTAH